MSSQCILSFMNNARRFPLLFRVKAYDYETGDDLELECETGRHYVTRADAQSRITELEGIATYDLDLPPTTDFCIVPA